MASSNEACGFAPALNFGRRLCLFGLRHQDKGGRGLRLVRRDESPADPVVLFDGNIEKHLRRLVAVGQCEEFVSDFDVFFDLLSEGCAFFTEL